MPLADPLYRSSSSSSSASPEVRPRRRRIVRIHLARDTGAAARGPVPRTAARSWEVTQAGGAKTLVMSCHVWWGEDEHHVMNSHVFDRFWLVLSSLQPFSPAFHQDARPFRNRCSWDPDNSLSIGNLRLPNGRHARGISVGPNDSHQIPGRIRCIGYLLALSCGKASWCFKNLEFQ